VADAGSWPRTDAARDSGVAFTLVGRFAVAVDGRAVDDRQVGSAKARRLLALLVVHRGRRVSLDRIIAALWATEPPERAAENVATLVSRLRRVLGAAVVRGARGSYGLGDGAGIWVDVDAAEELATRARDTMPTAPAVSLAAARRALDLAGTGELLENEPDAEWAHLPRLQLALLL
jgi:DNA-binding SARP family transcriptional activator